MKNNYVNDIYKPMNDSDQSHTPLIVVTEALPSEELDEDATVNFRFIFIFFLTF